MSRIIKDFNSFKESQVNEEFQWSDVGNFFSGILGFAGEGLRKTIKQKVAASLMERLGVEENSIFSTIIQEVVDQIPVKDYPELFTGEKANVEYLAPMMSKAIQELIQRKGIDGIAQQLGLKTDGWLFSTIREGLQSEKGRENIEAMLIAAFGGKDARGSVARDAISTLDPRDKDKLADVVKQRADKFYGKPGEKEEDKGFGDYISSFWNVLTGNKQTS
jgi:hypothetical protein